MRNSLVILNERIHIQIPHVIASLVIIAVIRHASFTSKQRYFFRRLVALSTGEESPGWYTSVLERCIIGAAIEFIRHPLESSIVGEIILEQLLRLCGAGRTSYAESVTVTVIDAVFVVGRGNHIEVEIEPDLGLFSIRKGGHVVCGAEKAKFFSGNPDEADSVVDAVFGELDSDFKDSNGAGAVVVNARTLNGQDVLVQRSNQAWREK